MSTLIRARGWIHTLVLVSALGFGAEARAESKVDWSQYLEQPGDRTARPKPTPTAEPAAAPRKTKATKGSRAQVAKQRPVASRATKTKTKQKPRPRRR